MNKLNLLLGIIISIIFSCSPSDSEKTKDVQETNLPSKLIIRRFDYITVHSYNEYEIFYENDRISKIKQLPFGEWRFYYDNSKLKKIESGYDNGVEPYTVSSSVDLEYDNNGRLIQYVWKTELNKTYEQIRRFELQYINNEIIREVYFFNAQWDSNFNYSYTDSLIFEDDNLVKETNNEDNSPYQKIHTYGNKNSLFRNVSGLRELSIITYGGFVIFQPALHLFIGKTDLILSETIGEDPYSVTYKTEYNTNNMPVKIDLTVDKPSAHDIDCQIEY